MSVRTRPVLLGPVSFLTALQGDGRLRSARPAGPRSAAYARVLRELAEANVAWVQIDEPVLALDLTGESQGGTRPGLQHAAPGSDARTFCWPAISVRSATISPRQRRCRWPACISIWYAEPDRTGCGTRRDADRIAGCPWDLVDGRNVWRTDLRAALGMLQKVAASARHSASDGGTIVQPAARAGRSRTGERDSIREVKRLAGLRRAEAGRGRDAGPRPGRRRVGHCRTARGQRRGCPVAADPATRCTGRTCRLAWRP